MDKTTKEYIDMLNNCKNIENIGNGCWEHCAYRENGCCEINKNKVITTFLQDIVGENITYSENFIWDLKNFIESTNQLVEKGVCVRKQGEWKYSPKENIAICSICGEEHYLGTYHQFATNFCPNCGAKMLNSK